MMIANFMLVPLQRGCGYSVMSPVACRAPSRKSPTAEVAVRLDLRVVPLVGCQYRIPRCVRRNGKPRDTMSQRLSGLDVEPVVDAAVHARHPRLCDHGAQVITLLREKRTQHF